MHVESRDKVYVLACVALLSMRCEQAKDASSGREVLDRARSCHAPTHGARPPRAPAPAQVVDAGRQIGALSHEGPHGRFNFHSRAMSNS